MFRLLVASLGTLGDLSVRCFDNYLHLIARPKSNTLRANTYEYIGYATVHNQALKNYHSARQAVQVESKRTFNQRWG